MKAYNILSQAVTEFATVTNVILNGKDPELRNWDPDDMDLRLTEVVSKRSAGRATVVKISSTFFESIEDQVPPEVHEQLQENLNSMPKAPNYEALLRLVDTIVNILEEAKGDKLTLEKEVVVMLLALHNESEYCERMAREIAQEMHVNYREENPDITQSAWDEAIEKVRSRINLVYPPIAYPPVNIEKLPEYDFSRFMIQKP